MRLADIAERVGGTVEGDGAIEIAGLSAIEAPEPGTLTFLADRRHEHHLATTSAAAVLVARGAPRPPIAAIRVDHPYVAFVALLEVFHPAATAPGGVHATAVIALTATIGPDATIGPHVVIGDGVRIGARAWVHANVTIYRGVAIGDDATIHAGVVIREGVRIGDRVRLHAGAVIGADGFGYLPLPAGNRKIPQVGTVVIEDDVEIGANATVDRATLGTTVVGRGAKLDNLVMVAHNCRIGEHAMIAAQTGLAGGTIVGTRVLLGGQVGSSGHLTIGDGAQVAAQSGLHGDVPAGARYGGYPATEVRLWRRMHAAIQRLPEALRRLRRVERQLGIGGPDDQDA